MESTWFWSSLRINGQEALGYCETLVWFLNCKITMPSRIFIPFVFTVVFLSSRGIPESQAECCLQKQKSPSRLSYFTETEMLCTRELNTARNGSRFVLACKIIGPSHYFYPSHLAFVGLADWSLKTLLLDPRLVLTCEITRPSKFFYPFCVYCAISVQ